MAALMALGGVLAIPASPAGAAEGDGSDVSTTRYGGPDRYATSLLIAEAFAVEAGGSLEWAVLVSGHHRAQKAIHRSRSSQPLTW